MSQRKRILDHLKRKGSVTSLDGLKCFNPAIIRVTNRVNELIAAGHPIEKERITTDDSHYTKYTYKPDKLVK